MAILLTFASIHAALAAEKAADRQDRTSDAEVSASEAPMLVPLPPQVKSDCGFGLLIMAADSLDDRRVADLLGDGVHIDGAYRVIETENGNSTRKEMRYERLNKED